MAQTSTQIYLIISAFIFGLVAIIHLVRAVNSWPFVVGPINIPVPASLVGFVLTAALCLWAIRILTSG